VNNFQWYRRREKQRGNCPPRPKFTADGKLSKSSCCREIFVWKYKI